MKQKNIGATALLTLETQILTLKETILCLEPMIKEEKSLSGSQGAPEGVAFETSGSERKAFDTKIPVNANDFKKLQEEYNTLLFKKHQVWCRSFVIPKMRSIEIKEDVLPQEPIKITIVKAREEIEELKRLNGE